MFLQPLTALFRMAQNADRDLTHMGASVRSVIATGHDDEFLTEVDIVAKGRLQVNIQQCHVVLEAPECPAELLEDFIAQKVFPMETLRLRFLLVTRNIGFSRVGRSLKPPCRRCSSASKPRPFILDRFSFQRN